MLACPSIKKIPVKEPDSPTFAERMAELGYERHTLSMPDGSKRDWWGMSSTEQKKPIGWASPWRDYEEKR